MGGYLAQPGYKNFSSANLSGMLGAVSWYKPLGVGCSTGAIMSVTVDFFRGLGAMLMEWVGVSCRFLACHGGSAKYQICLIFHRPSLTLVPSHGSSQLEPSSLVSFVLLVTSNLVLYYYHLVWKHLIACGPVSAHHSMAGHGRTIPTVQGNLLVANNPELIWSLPI